MDIIQVTATAARIMQWANAEAIPPSMPEYVTISDTGAIGYMMRTFGQVQEWAIYLETEYDYRETEAELVGKHGERGQVGFANARKTIHDVDHGDFYLHVFHNEQLKPVPQEALFPEDM